MEIFRSTKDGIAILVGLCAILGIGSWSLIATREKRSEHTITNDTLNETFEDFRKMSRNDLKNRLLETNSKRAESNEKPLALADIRPHALWEAKHIIGSESLPLEAIPSFSPNEQERSMLWVVISPNTKSANEATRLLKDKGIPEDSLFVLDGTTEDWETNIGLTTGIADPTSPVDATKVRLVTPEEAKRRLDEGGRWFILDTRSFEQFQEGHIAGATNIPFQDIEVRRRSIPSSAAILVYGNDDGESFSSGVRLFDLGFFNTLTISSGFSEWKSRGFPILNGTKDTRNPVERR